MLLDDELDILNCSTTKVDKYDRSYNHDTNSSPEHQSDAKVFEEIKNESSHEFEEVKSVRDIELDLGDGTFLYASVVDGELTGKCTLIKDGQNIAILQYEQGQIHGVCTFCQKSGVISAEVEYKYGKKDGTANYFNENGKLLKIENYVNDKKHGIFQSYYESSELYEKTEYDNDQVISWVRYNKDGSLITD